MTTQTNPSDTASPASSQHQEVPLITINISAQAPLKLTSTNYISWKLQFETLFIGYDLIGYINGSTPCPPDTITANDITVANPFHKLWIRQDQLLLNALIGSVSPTIIPFIARAETAKEAWTILANTYAKPSRGRIKQVKNQLKNPTKGTLTITEYLHSIKARADELAILGAPLDPEDLTDKILDGLGDDYKELVRAVQARDTSISFDELHEKLLSFEASTSASNSSITPLPITANPTQKTNQTWRPPKTNSNWRLSHSSPAGYSNWCPSANTIGRPPLFSDTRSQYRNNRPPSRPCQGFCQICGIQGHTAKRCPSFQVIPIQSSIIAPTSSNNPTAPW